MNKNCMVRQVSGTGIEIKCGDFRLAIDAFCRDESGIYPDTPGCICEDLFREIRAGDLKILIFTHEHSDHFNVPLVVSAWKLNQDLQILSNSAVAEQLIKAGVSRSNIKILIHGSEKRIPEYVQQWDVWKYGTFQIRGFYSRHAGKEYRDVEHISLILQAEEKKIVFLGDAQPEQELFQRIKEENDTSDWMFLPFSLMGRNSVRKKMAEMLQIGNIWILHCPVEEKDVFEWIKHTREICENASDGLPAPIFGQPEMMWHSL